jgi:hypothetical protein
MQTNNKIVINRKERRYKKELLKKNEYVTSLKEKIKYEIINYEERSIYGIYFICCIGNYIKIIEEQLNLLLYSGLFDKTKKIICYICNYNANDAELIKLFYNYFTKVEFYSTSENLYEKFAFNNFKKHLPQEPYYCYYMHTKGVSKPESSHIVQRRSILNFYTILKYEISLKLLKYYDAVGVTLFRYPKTHFSGNFWWTKSEHLCTLPDLIGDKYLEPEMYICSNSFGKYIGLSKEENTFESSDINHHYHLSDEEIINNINENSIINEWGKDVIHLC